MNVYDLVKQVLVEVPYARNNDRVLIWETWRRQNLVKDDSISLNDFLRTLPTESITRARRKIQEEERGRVNRNEILPQNSLLPSRGVAKRRTELAYKKGKHIFEEQVEFFEDV